MHPCYCSATIATTRPVATRRICGSGTRGTTPTTRSRRAETRTEIGTGSDFIPNASLNILTDALQVFKGDALAVTSACELGELGELVGGCGFTLGLECKTDLVALDGFDGGDDFGGCHCVWWWLRVSLKATTRGARGQQLFYDCDHFSVCLCKLDITGKATDDALWLTLEVFVSLCHHMSDNLVDDMAGVLPMQCKTSPALLLAHRLVIVIEEALGFHRTCKRRRMGLVVNPVFRVCSV